MIYIDPRAGSTELSRYLPIDIPHTHSPLTSGDFCFSGSTGPDEDGLIGIERKTIGDLVTCFYDGRLTGGQLRRMAEDYRVGYLVVEGLWKEGKGGELMVPRGRGDWIPTRPHTSYHQIWGYLTTLEMKTGIIVRRTVSWEDTASMVVQLYHWYQKPWEEHRSHQGEHQGKGGGGRDCRDNPVNSRRVLVTDLYTKHTLRYHIARQLPGVGQDKAREIEKVFPSVWAMINAAKEEWLGVDGIGKTMAGRIWEVIRRKDEPK